MIPKVVATLLLLFASTAHVIADEKSAQLDDTFTRQSAGQVALATQAQQCELRSSIWRDKLIAAVAQRLLGHFKTVRPTWTETDDKAIIGQILYGALFAVNGDVGAPKPDQNDIMKLGQKQIEKSMLCHIIIYRKTDILYLDSIIDGGGS